MKLAPVPRRVFPLGLELEPSIIAGNEMGQKQNYSRLKYSVMKRELTGDQMTTWLSLGRQSECVEGRIQEQTGTDGELTAAEARNVGWVGGLGWNLAGWSAGWWDGARRGGLGVERLLLLALLLCCACCLLGWLGAAR
jgi:hypothetical protein